MVPGSHFHFLKQHYVEIHIMCDLPVPIKSERCRKIYISGFCNSLLGVMKRCMQSANEPRHIITMSACAFSVKCYFCFFTWNIRGLTLAHVCKMTKTAKCPSDVFQLPHLSNRQSKTQTHFIHCHNWQSKTANPHILVAGNQHNVWQSSIQILVDSFSFN